MTALPSGVPPLDSFAEDWLHREELAHLHSLRNQWGQAHVNADLTSLSWLAIPPFSGGYHTGALRIDGDVLAAEHFRWAPWGVSRRAGRGGVTVETDTRLGYESTDAFWSVTLTNESSAPRVVEVDLELLAPIAHSEVDWGWLYGTPWNAGHYHDYYATERLRTEVLADAPRQVQLLGSDPRRIRLGSPRIPGIQRDENTSPMLLEYELPDHSTRDAGRYRSPAARGTVREVTVRAADGTSSVFPGEWILDRDDIEHRVGLAALAPEASIALDLELADPSIDGVILTHGNHPDSLQLAIRDGRIVLSVGGERVVGSTVLGAGRHVLEARIAHSGASLLVDGVVDAETRPWWDGQRWEASRHGEAVVVVDSASPARSTYAFSPAPTSLEVSGSRGRALWRVELAPGASWTAGVVLAIDVDGGGGPERSLALAAAFPARFDAIADRWRNLWANAFTPGNPDHSGHLPAFSSPSAGLEDGYYLGTLLALYMRNTGVSGIGPVFLTGGPRLGPTVTFYWDQSEWARTAAMLEPVGMRAWILAALAQDYDASHSFDTRNLLPVGNHYAANDHALFTIVERYVGVTGDSAILDERAGQRTVLQHLQHLCDRARTARAGFGGGELVDLGRDAWELLECVPNYRDAVVSFNAGYVGMLRSLAALLRSRGDAVAAEGAEADAARLAAAVLGQYAGGGRWAISHPEGDDVIGHCLDFELVAAHMHADLTESQRLEMVAFVCDHLLDGDWMRALAPDDPVAPYSDRPDHGAAGAFAGWPGSTSYGLAKLGRPDLAADFLSRIHASRSGALWGQAVEAIGDGRFRVAERGVANRDSNAAVAATEAVIAGLFGIEAGFGTAGTGSLVTAFGALRNVRAVGFDLAATGSPSVFPEDHEFVKNAD